MKKWIAKAREWFESVESIKREIHFVSGVMHELLNREEKGRGQGTYVLVLPPNGLMLGQMHHVPKGVSMQVTFDSPVPIPKGSWVVSFGPAALVDVRIGNQSQVVYPGAYPAIITIDELGPGQLVRAVLQG